jgi:hypothetical protein
LSLYVLAVLLIVLSVLCLGPMSVWLERVTWAQRAPKAGVLLWQALGLGGGLSAIGAGLAVAVARFRVGFFPGLGELVDKVIGGHPLAGLGLSEALGLTLAADVAIVLAFTVTTLAFRIVRTRARHRRLLDLVSIRTTRTDGTVLLDHPSAAAYCVPGIRPRIVLSVGAVDLLGSTELSAVVEHERGHAHEHHGLVLLPLVAMTEPLRWIPYARYAPRAVTILLEMAADDYAARRHDPAVLASALVRMGTARFAPRFALCAAAGAVDLRVTRLLAEGRTSRAVALGSVGCALVLVAAPVLALMV